MLCCLCISRPSEPLLKMYGNNRWFFPKQYGYCTRFYRIVRSEQLLPDQKLTQRVKSYPIQRISRLADIPRQEHLSGWSRLPVVVRQIDVRFVHDQQRQIARAHPRNNRRSRSSPVSRYYCNYMNVFESVIHFLEKLEKSVEILIFVLKIS